MPTPPPTRMTSCKTGEEEKTKDNEKKNEFVPTALNTIHVPADRFSLLIVRPSFPPLLQTVTRDKLSGPHPSRMSTGLHFTYASLEALHVGDERKSRRRRHVLRGMRPFRP